MESFDEQLTFIKHHQVDVQGISVHVAEAGSREDPPIIFLHGYPEDWMSFMQLMLLLRKKYHVLAIDLPGIGKSDPLPSGSKKRIAAFVADLVEVLALPKIALAGHDIGGMVTYAFIKSFPEKLSKAIIMNTALPGIPPWEEVKRNPSIWHFAFYATPSLPEVLAEGRQRPLFNYFYDSLAANRDAIPESMREHYTHSYRSHAALQSGFGWYRAFAEDEKDNSDQITIDLPLLYVRGDKEFADIGKYTGGLQQKGMQHIQGHIVPGCGHFAPEEQPEMLAMIIDEFLQA